MSLILIRIALLAMVIVIFIAGCGAEHGAAPRSLKGVAIAIGIVIAAAFLLTVVRRPPIGKKGRA